MTVSSLPFQNTSLSLGWAARAGRGGEEGGVRGSEMPAPARRSLVTRLEVGRKKIEE